MRFLEIIFLPPFSIFSNCLVIQFIEDTTFANFFVENWRANNVEQIDIHLYTALDNKLDIKDLPFYSQLIWKSW
jgi:hypothetical protein